MGKLVDKFSKVFKENAWRCSETVSGFGSTLAQTQVIRSRLKILLDELGIRSILDIPCGDFNWMKCVDLTHIHYIGADIVPELIDSNRERFSSVDQIQFEILDATTDPLPKVDMILCRDLMGHLTFKDALAALDNFNRSGSKYMLCTNFPVHNNVDLADDSVGWRPINLAREPFSIKDPTRSLLEECSEDNGKWKDKELGLWEFPLKPTRGCSK